jgi:hypothetical protein
VPAAEQDEQADGLGLKRAGNTNDGFRKNIVAAERQL